MPCRRCGGRWLAVYQPGGPRDWRRYCPRCNVVETRQGEVVWDGSAELLTTRQAAQLLGVTTKAVRGWTHRGRLPTAEQEPMQWWYERGVVEAFLAAGNWRGARKGYTGG